MKHLRTMLTVLLCALLLGSGTGCKLSEDAVAASQQMTATAAALHLYYGTLDAEVGNTVALFELDGAIAGIPYGDADRALQQTTRDELKKRRDMAFALQELAGSMRALTTSTAPADFETSLNGLGNQLIDLKALPSGSPVPAAIGKAGNLLLQIVQQHEAKKAARAMDDTLAAMDELFTKEKPVYDSLARTHAKQAGEVAQDLIAQNAVDPTRMLAPALEPYGLTAVPPSPALQTTLKQLASSRLKTATAEATRKEEAASTAMAGALHEMSARVHLVATEKPMPLRGEPFSLKLVLDWTESWAASLL